MDAAMFGEPKGSWLLRPSAGFKRVAILVQIAVILALLQPSSAQNAASEIARFNASPSVANLARLEELGSEGDASASFRVGQAYFSGEAVPISLTRAAEWFEKSTLAGEPNAPVWAGMAFEALGDPESAAEMHRIASERGLHITSALALGRFHSSGLIAAASREHSARYMAAYEVILTRTGNASANTLDGIDCVEIAKAVYVEQQIAPRNSSDEEGDALIDLLTKCFEETAAAELREQLIELVASRLDRTGQFAIDETRTSASFLSQGGQASVAFAPSVFRAIVAFASDADAADTETSLAAESFLNDQLGLPIASSVYPYSFRRPRTSNFFSGIFELDDSAVDGRPNWFQLAKAWHRGSYDHIHSWYDEGSAFIKRPNASSLRGGVQIELDDFAAQISSASGSPDRVVRIYFSSSPPEDVTISFFTKDGQKIGVNTATLQYTSRIERDEGTEFYAIVLPVSLLARGSSTEADQKLTAADLARLVIESPSCQATSCGITVNKIEVDVFDRNVARAQAEWMLQLNVLPYGFTSHGGDLWDLHDDPSTAVARQLELLSETAVFDNAVPLRGIGLGNLMGTKGYVEDILTELKVRAIRPTQTPQGVPANTGVHDWSTTAPIFPLYADKFLFSTTAFLRAPVAGQFFLSQADFIANELPNFQGLVRDGCGQAYCGVEHVPLLSALVGASFERAKSVKGALHIWYTHFGSRTASFEPTQDEPFPGDVRDALVQLSVAQYGMDVSGARTGLPRVLVRPSSSVLRSRKLRSIVQSGLLEIEQRGSIIELGKGFDPYLGKPFPDPEHIERDLAGITFEVGSLEEASIIVNGKPVDAITFYPRADGQGGEVSIVDNETRTTLVSQEQDGARLALGVRQDQTCTNVSPAALFNVTHMSFTPSSSESDLEILLKLRTHDQVAYGIGSGEKEILISTLPDELDIRSSASRSVYGVDARQIKRGGAPVYVDLAQPVAAARTHDAAGVASYGPNGTVQEVCVRTASGRASKSKMKLSDIRFYRPTTADLDRDEVGVVVGGVVSRQQDDGEHQIAFAYANLDSGKKTIITASEDHYVGKLSSGGRYSVSLVRQGCPTAERQIVELVEADNLGLDLEVSGCQVSRAQFG